MPLFFRMVSTIPYITKRTIRVNWSKKFIFDLYLPINLHMIWLCNSDVYGKKHSEFHISFQFVMVIKPSAVQYWKRNSVVKLYKSCMRLNHCCGNYCYNSFYGTFCWNALVISVCFLVLSKSTSTIFESIYILWYWYFTLNNCGIY